MLWRGRRAWLTAALVLALLFTAIPGNAAAGPQKGQPWPGWQGLWEWVTAWFGGDLAAPADQVGREKSSSSIDPNGQPAPTGTTQADSSSQIDPDGHH